MKLYGIANCDTVKKARTYLEHHKINFEFVDFKKIPPTEADIERWGKAFGGFPVNEKGQTYKKYKLEFEVLAAKNKGRFIAEHPSMIKRPILEKGAKILAFGFREEDYKEQLGL
ncbi:MAG: arsenate reductase family protein [Bacteriovoracaceae bacterium]